jgi:hypothetical protein
VVLSGTRRPGDARRAYDLHANAFVRKKESLPELIESLDAICRLFLKAAVPPNRPEE